MYDSLSADYDRFVNWSNRLALEMPFIEAYLIAAGGNNRSIRVLDAACGTGMHAIALALRGYHVTGADLSSGMIERASANAKAAGVQVQFCAAGFGVLAQTFTDYDALLCLGNSLPHVLSSTELLKTLLDFADCLRSNGALLIQNRNFDAILAKRERWMDPQSYREDDREWIFLRFYDFDPDGLLTFHMITLHRSGQASWQQKLDSSRLYPLRHDELTAALQRSGFGQVVCYGSMDGQPFDPETSSNLVVLARK